MSTLHLRTRRPSARTTNSLPPHSQGWRACNDPTMAEDDAFAVARAIINALCIGGAVFGVAVALWVGAVVLMGW